MSMNPVELSGILPSSISVPAVPVRMLFVTMFERVKVAAAAVLHPERGARLGVSRCAVVEGGNVRGDACLRRAVALRP